MPFTFEVKSLILSSAKYCSFSTICALYRLFLLLFLLFLGFFRFHFFFLLIFLFLFKTLNKFKCTKLLIFKAFVLFVENNSNQYLNNNFIEFFACLIDLTIFARLNIVNSNELISFNLLFLDFFNL
jgi:hypothetical protein